MSQYGGRPGQMGQQRPQQSFPIPTDATLKAIVLEGEGKPLVESAQLLGKALWECRLTSSQIRGVFGSVRLIQAKWPFGVDGPQAKVALRQLLLLKPKLAYQSSRDKSGGVERLQQVLVPAIDLVTTREHLQHLADYFEAILAYHKAEESRR